MAENDRFDKFDKKKNGRPAKSEAEKKTEKVLMSFTKKEYEKLKRYQMMFGKKTLTSTLEHLIVQGEERVREEFESFRGR